jgi:hypothetical protein
MSMSGTTKASENTKFERVYENEYSKSIWRYDYSITKSGPVSVSITYKKDILEKKQTLGDLIPKKKSRKK